MRTLSILGILAAVMGLAIALKESADQDDEALTLMGFGVLAIVLFVVLTMIGGSDAN